MSTGAGEDGGLRAAPIVPDEAVEALTDLPDGYADGAASETAGADSPVDSVTQQLPMVRREGLGEPPSVRAVARRVPSALPALGRDEITDAPHSARTTAFRRRRAAAEGRAESADESPAAPSDPAGTGQAPGHPDPAEPVAEVVEPVADRADPVADPVEPAATNVRSIELVIAPLSPAEPAPAAPVVPNLADRRAELEPMAPVARSHGMPVSLGGEVTARLMGQPAAPADGDVLDAEILDDPPSSRSNVNAAAAEVPTSLTEVALREARPDEWIMGQPGPVGEPSAVLDPIRPGPVQLESDSWDTGSLPAIQQNPYQGRRRAVTAGARLWVVTGLVVAALSAAIAIPFLLTSGPSAPAVAPTPDSAVDNASGLPSSPDSATPTSPAPAPAVGASPLITPSPTVSSNASSDPHPVLLTIQAEQGSGATVWGGTAGPPSSFAGATVIDELGEHWPGGSQDGWLEFRSVMAPSAGQYVIKIYYVYTDRTPDHDQRQMNVFVNGTNVLHDHQFSRTSTIAVLDVNVTLRAGSNTVRLIHRDFESPAIDRIEITEA